MIGPLLLPVFILLAVSVMWALSVYTDWQLARRRRR